MSTSATTAALDLLDEHAAALAARDPERVTACYSAEPVMYTLAPPLRQRPDSEYATTVEGLTRWFATFDSPIQIDYQNPVVTTDGDVAFAHTLTKMTTTPAGAPEPFSFWFRSTFGLRRQQDGWRIVHRHDSVPFHMDGSFRAAVDLQP